MTSQPDLSVLGFTPEQLVLLSVGCYQVNLYPKLSPSSSVLERAHAFQICKSALSTLNINIHILFDALGSQLNCMATIDGLVYNYTQIYKEGWYNPANLQILSFHDSTGMQINITTIARNPAILLPIVNGHVADCRQKDVRYVCVQLSLDFAGLLGPQHIGESVIKSVYYIELPQTSVNMTNGVGAAYVLTTYHGLVDITSMTAEQVLVDIINPCLQRGPISLSRADFNLQEANTDSTTVKDQLINKTLVLGYASICASVFAILCPGYSNQPHAILDHIRQASPGPDGQIIVASMHEFIQRVINTLRPFAARKTLPISICDHIIRNLDRWIIPSFCKLYPDHATPHGLDGAIQRKKVQEILAAAQQAEDKVHQVQEIACGITGQSFHYKAPLGTPMAETTAAPIPVGAYPSQAECTLAKNESKGSFPSAAKSPYKQMPCKCFGYGAPSLGFQDKDGNITCPYGHDPSVKANAERKYRAYQDRLAKKYKARMAKFRACGRGGGGCGGGRPSSKFALDYHKLSAKDQKKIRDQVLAAQAAQNTELVFMLTSKLGNVTVLASINAPPRRTLPIEIHSNFPHIILQLGATLGGPDSPSIRAVIDTAAALTTGNLHFFAKIAKAFPHTVAAIYAPKD